MSRIKFYKVSDEYGCFSNFYKHCLVLDGERWNTVEHYFQAQKFLDKDQKERIRTAKTPMEAARLGRSRDTPIRCDWEAVKDEVMRKAVIAKFSSDDRLRDILLSTGDAMIIEDTTDDYYWGCGKDGSGKNMLGVILMETRGFLRGKAPNHTD